MIWSLIVDIVNVDAAAAADNSECEILLEL